MLNMRNPLSAFSSREPNVASYMIAQQQQNIDNAIAYLVDLWFDDVDIREEEIFYSVLKKYKLTNVEILVIINNAMWSCSQVVRQGTATA